MYKIIAAIARNGIIGNQGKLPWPRIDEDMKRFRRLTLENQVIMGRKTFESLHKPLEKRINIVLSHDTSFVAPDGVIVVNSLQNLLSKTNPEKVYWVIGGGEIYSLFLPLSNIMYITYVDCFPEGDTSFPLFPITSQNGWTEINLETHHGYSFVEYKRNLPL